MLTNLLRSFSSGERCVSRRRFRCPDPSPYRSSNMSCSSCDDTVRVVGWRAEIVLITIVCGCIAVIVRSFVVSEWKNTSSTNKCWKLCYIICQEYVVVLLYVSIAACVCTLMCLYFIGLTSIVIVCPYWSDITNVTILRYDEYTELPQSIWCNRQYSSARILSSNQVDNLRLFSLPGFSWANSPQWLLPLTVHIK